MSEFCRPPVTAETEFGLKLAAALKIGRGFTNNPIIATELVRRLAGEGFGLGEDRSAQMSQITEELNTAEFHLPYRFRQNLRSSGRAMPNDQKGIMRLLCHEASLPDFWDGGKLFRLVGGGIMDACGIAGATDKKRNDIIILNRGDQFAQAKRAKKDCDQLDPDQRSMIERSGSWRIELVGRENTIHMAETQSEIQSNGHGKSHQTTVDISQSGQLKYIGDRTTHENGSETGVFEKYYIDKDGKPVVELGRRVAGRKQPIGRLSVDLSVFEDKDAKFALGLDPMTRETHQLMLDRHFAQYLQNQSPEARP